MSKKSRVAIFGLGNIYKQKKGLLKNIEVIAYVDNDKEKQGEYIEGVKVISPAELIQVDVEYIILMSIYHVEMREQLVEIGIDNDKIISYDNLLFFEYCEKNNAEKYNEEYKKHLLKDKKNILLLSSEMTLTGAAIVLYYFALLLKKNGYNPVVVAPKRGELEKYYTEEGIPVFYEKHIRSYNMELVGFMNECDLILVNTIILSDIIFVARNVNKPFIWWIHESGKRCETVNDPQLVEAFSDNLHIYGVGKCALNTLHSIWENVQVKNLLYGLPDVTENIMPVCSGEKIVFALVGLIYDVKGQDIFLQAIEQLTEDAMEKAEFWIVGRVINEPMFEKIKPIIEKYDNVKYLGELHRKQMQEIYSKIDVLVCPSRRDTMPVVTIEAMMNHRPCIVSDVIGTAEYIEDGVNGFVCPTEDTLRLAQIMELIIKEPEIVSDMGDKARKVFENHFSMDSFEKEAIKIVRELLEV